MKTKKPKLQRPKVAKLRAAGKVRVPKKLPRPAVPERLKRRQQTPEQKIREAIKSAPRITNETVTEHREEVLAGARKYIYPLQHSKHRVVRISASLLVVVLLAFFIGTGLALYKFQSTGGFIYDVTKIVPFPVARAGGQWVSYESYLFELRRNMHYYKTQQAAEFKSKDGKAQLKRLKTQAMDDVVQNAYVRKLAKENSVSVSDRDVNDEVGLVRKQNRLGGSDRAFREVLNEFWGWDEADFKRELKQQLLRQAVVGRLDTVTQTKARSTLTQLHSGANFADLAGKLSDDPVTKATGGQYPNPIAYNDRDLSPKITSEIFSLKSAGQTSGIINTGYTLEIVKLTEVNGSSRRAAHIQFTLKPITTFTKPVQAKQPDKHYIKF